MAIDTATKRANMLSFASPLAWQIHPVPDGTIAVGDRAHLLHLYGGNGLDSPVAGGGSGVEFWNKRRQIMLGIR